jgi:hypothetical protein
MTNPNRPLPTPEEADPQTPVTHGATTGEHMHPHEHPASEGGTYTHVHSHRHEGENAHDRHIPLHVGDEPVLTSLTSPDRNETMRMQPSNQPIINPAAAQWPWGYSAASSGRPV